jgi:penicillin amidase
MAWDLSGSEADLRMTIFTEKLGEQAANELFPENRPYEVPIIPNEKTPLPSSAIHSEKPVQLTERKRYSDGRRCTHLKPSCLLAFPVFVGDEFKGSNNWVIDGAKSATGRAILCSDPHLGHRLPSIWYEAHLVSPTRNVYGVTFPGGPVVLIGFNDHIAWGLTNGESDVLDFYAEKFDSEKHERYLFNGEWKPVEKIPTVIKVKGQEDIKIDLEFTHYGPVLTREKETAAMKWTGSDPSGEKTV